MILWRLPTDRYTFCGYKHWESFNERCSVFVRGIVHCCCKKTISCIAYPALWSIHTLHAWTGLRLLNSKYNYYKLGSACAKTKLVWSCKYLDSKSRRWFCFHPTLKNTCDWWSLGFSRNASKTWNTTYTEALFKSFNTIQSYQHSSNLSVFTS